MVKEYVILVHVHHKMRNNNRTTTKHITRIIPGELTIAKTSVVTSITGYFPSAIAISFSLSPLTNVGQQCEVAGTTACRNCIYVCICV